MTTNLSSDNTALPFPLLEAKPIGLRLRAIRLVFGYQTVRDAAQALGQSRSRWSNWEVGIVPPPLQMMADLCAVHPDLTLDWIYLGREDGLTVRTARQLREALQRASERPSRVPGHVPDAK